MAYGETIDVENRLFRRLTGDQAILAQAIRLRLDTRRGTYWDDPGYGLALSEFVAEGLTPAAAARIPSLVQAELEKDERIGSVAVSSAVRPGLLPGTTRIEIGLVVRPQDGESFPLTLAVTELGVELLTEGA